MAFNIIEASKLITEKYTRYFCHAPPYGSCAGNFVAASQDMPVHGGREHERSGQSLRA